MKKTMLITGLILILILANIGGYAQQENNSGENGDAIILNILAHMTLEEKAGQVFIMSLRNIPVGQPIRSVTPEVAELIRKFHPGGIILFGENLYSPLQTKGLLEGMQAVSQIPLFMAIDEEGGAISRLNELNNKMHATKLPNNRIIGSTGEPDLARKAGMVIGGELVVLGFNMVFAPVADVNTNPANPVIGPRSFGAVPEKVAQMVAAEVEGLHSQNVMAVLKHFPGHGDTSNDTHTGAVIVPHGRERLNKVEFTPFISGMKAGAAGIMTAHVQVPEVTGDKIPATFSRKILTGILREEMGFEGLIITDALEMGAITKFWSADDAAVRAFEAGADILLMPADLERAYAGLLNAINEGRITEKRLDESVIRILKAKYTWHILENKKNTFDPEMVLGCKEHLEIAQEIRKKANK